MPTLAKLKYKKALIVSVWFGMLSLSNCEQVPEPSPIICSCDANGSQPFRDIPSIVINTIDGYYLLSPATGFYKPCEPIEAGLQIDGSMVWITGETKATYDKPDDRFKVEKLHYSILGNAEPAVDSLFSGPPYSIKIIQSEDYGYPVGYGYRISHSGGFKIIQPIIPAIGGLKPFRTEAEAFKVAVLVAYKLHEEIGLPPVTIEDLDFLKIGY